MRAVSGQRAGRRRGRAETAGQTVTDIFASELSLSARIHTTSGRSWQNDGVDRNDIVYKQAAAQAQADQADLVKGCRPPNDRLSHPQPPSGPNPFLADPQLSESSESQTQPLLRSSLDEERGGV